MSLLAPLTAHSLGVGDIQLHSALNQKLNAEIALSLAADENIDNIKVSLATPEKFNKLGIAWSYFLSTVKFHPVVKANGKVVIKMTSDEVVQEPFLDFLVEVSWPKGDIFKEFTVLVDPPVVYQQAKIEAPTISSTKPSYRSPEPVTAAPNEFSAYAGEGEYGPISRYDSLWKIAKQVKDGDTSVEQMMMALYKANPAAFYKPNVNALMQGKTLKIPEKSEILKLTKKQANTQFYRQMAVWEGRVAPSKPEIQIASDIDNSNQLTLIPPEDEISAPSTGISAANAEDTEELEAENQKLQDRLANLEKQFAIMQEMMAIKDQQLAVMQNVQTDQQQEVPPKQPVTPDVEPTQLVVEPTQPTDTTVIVEKPPVKPPVAIKQPVPKPPQPAVVEDDSEVSYYYLGLGLFGLLSVGAIGWLFWRRRQAEEEINDNSMFAASSAIFLPDSDEDLDVNVLDEKSSYDVGTVGESSFLSEFTPSDFDVFETDQAEVDPTSEADVYLAYGRYQQAEELMRQAIIDSPDKDAYKLKLLEIFFTSENAQGYEEFAKELAAEDRTTDHEFWAKVTEMGGELIPESALFSSEQSKAEFVTADEPTGDSSNIIDDVAEVENPSTGEDDLDFDLSSFSLSDGSETTESGGEATAEIESDSVDFDISSFSLADDSESESAEANDETSAEVDSDIESVDFDFDLSSLDSQEATPSDLDEEGSSDVSLENEIESIEFNTDDIDIEGFDLSEEGSALAESSDASSVPEIKAEEEQIADESSNNDFDFNFDEISDAPVDQAADSDSHAEIDLMVSDLTDMDEFETKIDLAKAYIDMGDEQAARNIAQEVLEKGNEAQKGEAQAIIDKIS